MLHFKKVDLILFPRANSNDDDIEKWREYLKENEYTQETLTNANCFLQPQGQQNAA